MRARVAHCRVVDLVWVGGEKLRLVSGRLAGGSAPCLSAEYIPSISYTPLQPTSSLCIDYSYTLNPEIRRDKKVSR